jgi:hypothetical protein
MHSEESRRSIRLMSRTTLAAVALLLVACGKEAATSVPATDAPMEVPDSLGDEGTDAVDAGEDSAEPPCDFLCNPVYGPTDAGSVDGVFSSCCESIRGDKDCCRTLNSGWMCVDYCCTDGGCGD